MLSLTFQVNDRAALYDKTGTLIGFIQLIEKNGQRAKVGFEFPKEITILREDILRKMGNGVKVPEKVEGVA